jgi:hypothetical protein
MTLASRAALVRKRAELVMLVRQLLTHLNVLFAQAVASLLKMVSALAMRASSRIELATAVAETVGKAR